MGWVDVEGEEVGKKPKSKEDKRKALIAKYQKEIAAEEGTLSAMAIGAGKKTHDLIEGVKSLFQGDDYEGSNLDAGEGYEALREESPWAVGGGEALAEIAQLVVPGGAATKAMKLAGVAKGAKAMTAVQAARAARMTKAAPFVGDLAASAGMAALRKPGEGDTRFGNASSDALASIAGGAAGKALGKMVYGINKVEGAEEAMGRGVDMTLRHASDGGFGKGVDRFLKTWIPGVSPTMELLENSAAKMWHMDAVKAAALPGTKLTKHGRKGVEQVSREFKKQYQDAWNKVTETDLNIDGAVNILKDAKMSAALTGNDEAFVSNLLKGINKNIKAMESAPADQAGIFYNQIDKLLQGAKLEAIGKDKTLVNNIIVDAIDEFRFDLPNPVKKSIAELDQAYPGFLAIDKAAKAAKGDIGQFSPDQLINAVTSVGGGEQWRAGLAPLQEIAETGLRTIGRKNDLPATGVFKELVRSFPGVAPQKMVKGVLDPLLGNSPTQRLLQKVDKARKVGLGDMGKINVGNGKTAKIAVGGIDEIIGAARLGSAANNEGDSPLGTSKKEIDSAINKLIKMYGL